MSRKTMLAAVACAATAGMTALAQAAPPGTELQLIKQPAERFHETIESHQELRRYEDLLKRAKRLDVAPADDLLGQRDLASRELQRGIEDLRDRIARAEREPEFGLAPGVSQGTLEAIAACESGGDPSAVNPAGYYGKYQFDMGTWASVGGSGNPAAAPEAEQDYRASLLYSRAGASPWPVCGA